MITNQLFEQVLKEANNTEKVYRGGNPNSLAAWTYVDITPSKNGRIFIDDKFGKFEWDQNKSNQNVRRISPTISGEGKGFSYYFARYAYSDEYRYQDVSLSTGGHSGSYAKIYLEFLKKFIGSTQLAKATHPKTAVLLVIDEVNNDSTTTIISAYYTTDKNALETYADNYAEQVLMKTYDSQQGKFEEETDPIRDSIKAKLIMKIKDSLIKGAAEFEQLIMDS